MPLRRNLTEKEIALVSRIIMNAYRQMLREYEKELGNLIKLIDGEVSADELIAEEVETEIARIVSGKRTAMDELKLFMDDYFGKDKEPNGT